MIVRRRLALYAPSGGGGPPDTTPPTLTGTVTVGTVTSTSIQVSHPAGADNVAVTSYEYSTDGTSWSDSGSTATTYTFTGLTPSTSYTLRVRARDAAGNVSTPAISVTQSTSAGSDTTPPTLTGSITIGTVTDVSIQMSWPAGADNVAVTSYEVSSNGGGSWTDTGSTSTTYTFTGLTPSTSYGLRVRAKDAAGNVSTPALSATQSTNASSAGTITLGPFASSGTLWPAGTVVHYEWQQGGRIGSAPTSATRGSVTIVTAGLVPLTGLPSGAGFALLAKRNTAATDDEVGYQAGTVA